MKKTRARITGFILFLIAASVTVQAQANPEIVEVAKNKLKEKTMQSGTLDIFDNDITGVRNLRLIKMNENVVEEGGAYLIAADYRDINTGEIVEIEVMMVSGAKDFMIKNTKIKNVQAIKNEDEGREYTDSEIQECMRAYLEKQGQFSDGKVMLFDKDKGDMRNLELTELKEEVRRMGKFYNSSAKFRDADNNDILDIDISVENKKGKLKVKALRIRNVRKGLVGKDISQ